MNSLTQVRWNEDGNVRGDMFKGSIPALVTPFDEAGALDEAGYRTFVEWQIAEGSHGVVPVGTTGESPTLTHDEHKRAVEICVETVNKRIPVIAGAGSNNTAEAIDLARFAESAGADGLLVVTPYYNKPTQRGLYAHYAAIAKAVSLPIIIYNIPGRSIIDMTPETMGRLAKDFDNIIGVKDATAKVERVSEQRLSCGQDFVQLSGEDATCLGFNAHGGVGCISVTANVAPALCANFQAACAQADFETALSEPNPAGVKYALSRIGRGRNTLRSPMVPIEASTEKAIDDALRHAGLLD